MSKSLKLTKQELEGFVNGKLPSRFEEVFNDIPMYHPSHIQQKGETHRSYVEDDGREYRWFIFKDSQTGVEYVINYIFHQEWPSDIFEKPENIEYVKDPKESDLYVEPKPVIEPEKELTPVQQKDKEIMAQYNAMKSTCRIVEPKEKLEVPKQKIKELLDLLKKEYFTIYDVRAIAYPICIEYKLEGDSFWRWIQVKRRVWKA